MREKDVALREQEATLQEQEAALQAKDAEIARLMELLRMNEQNRKDQV